MFLIGMDYPDVTLVIQVGVTSREQYIHRLGRTARAGKVSYLVFVLDLQASIVMCIYTCINPY
jgi:superfamily II DNA/RNA helicase